MRVALLSREFPPAIGGIGDHTDRLASALTTLGHHLTVICARPGEPRPDYDVRPVGTTWSRTEQPDVVAEVAACSPEAIVWQYNPFAIGSRGIPSGAPAFAASLAAIAPLTLSIHELWFPWGRSGARGVVWALAQRAAGRSVLRAASRWVVTTEERERALRSLDPARTVRIPIGANVEPADSALSREQARAALSLPPEAFVVVHMGAAGSGRDFGPVVFAIRQLREQGVDARLLFAGRTGPFDPPAAIRDAVVVTGTLPRERLSDALRAGDAYVHADPVGASAGRRGTLVAALAHGLPIVAYRGPDQASELRDGHNILVAERTPAAMARALSHLVTNPDDAARIGRNGRETYDATFSWSCIAAAFSVVLEGKR